MRRPLQLTLCLTHDCTLRCRYCYAGRKYAHAMSRETAERGMDIGLAEAVNTAIPNGLQALMEKDDLLMGLTDYLKDNTNYVDNGNQEAKASLLSLVQHRVEQADRALGAIFLKADKIVPRNHPSRLRD